MSGCFVLATVAIPGMDFLDGGYSVDFTLCALAQGVSASGTGVDGILRRCQVAVLGNETINLSGGTNASPSASGNLDKIQLIANGCAVTTN